MAGCAKVLAKGASVRWSYRPLNLLHCSFLYVCDAVRGMRGHSVTVTVSRRGGQKDWQEPPRAWQKTPKCDEARMRSRGPAGREAAEWNAMRADSLGGRWRARNIRCGQW